jgi:hypothetical protein
MGRVPLPPGRHTVQLDHEDYEPYLRQFDIVAGETFALKVNLPEQGVKRKRR